MSTIKILLVDDEADSLGEFFNELHEYDVIIETSPEKALELLKTHNFSIIISDYQMPVINGIEFLEEAKRLYHNKKYISFLATAHGTSFIFEEEHKRGIFNHLIMKPYQQDSVLKAIHEAFAELEGKKENIPGR